MADRTGCTVDECGRPVHGHGMCDMHWSRWYKHGDPHYLGKIMPPKGATCSVPGCDRPFRCKWLCQLHYSRLMARGDALAEVKVKDGRGFLTTNGYRMLYHPEHCESTKRGEVLEHRMVMSDLLGRPLFPDEHVHHINGVKHDNRPENLELWSSSHPSGQRVEDKLAWALEIIARYGDSR